jgi:hypothetical protein
MSAQKTKQPQQPQSTAREDAAAGLFEGLQTYNDVEQLIANGEPEGLHIECKAPSEPRLSRDLRSHLATALSGFANTAGGVLIYGVSTTRHEHSGLDVLSQMEPIGHCKSLDHQIKRTIPVLSTPPILNCQTKTLTRNPTDTRGLVLLHIPHVKGDPVQSTVDHLFHFRTGDEFKPAPYEVIKRLFAATDAPDIRVTFDSALVKREKNQSWVIPIVVENSSAAIGEHILISVTIENPSACESISSGEFRDVSDINPGKSILMLNIQGVVHRGMNMVAGRILVTMKKAKRAKRRLDLTLEVYANKMRARQFRFSVKLAKRGFSVKNVGEQFLY